MTGAVVALADVNASPMALWRPFDASEYNRSCLGAWVSEATQWMGAWWPNTAMAACEAASGEAGKQSLGRGRKYTPRIRSGRLVQQSFQPRLHEVAVQRGVEETDPCTQVGMAEGVVVHIIHGRRRRRRKIPQGVQVDRRIALQFLQQTVGGGLAPGGPRPQPRGTRKSRNIASSGPAWNWLVY